MEAIYQRACVFVQEVVEAARVGNPFRVEPGFALVIHLVDQEGGTEAFYKRAIYARESPEDAHGFASAAVIHSVNVCIYALRIGEGMGLKRDRLVDLGVAALLHDVGMARLPETLIEKREKLTPAELTELRQHPAYGHEMLSQLTEDYRWLAEVALQEQEREDGSGYPRGLKGDQIQEYARIIAVADCFAGLTRSRPDRKGMMPFEAVRFILQSQRTQLYHKAIKALVTKLTAFPLRTKVRLNSGAIGLVVKTFEAQPLRPAVAVICDSQGNLLDSPKIVDLREMPILHIAGAI